MDKGSTYYKLNSFNVCDIYYFIESYLTFSGIWWSHGLTVKDRNIFNNIVKICSTIIGVWQREVRSIWEEQTAQKTKGIICQPNHILHE